VHTIQDGTLTDSIAAVEAAWSKVACEIGEDPAFVIAATHGRRAIDNLARFKPHLLSHELSAAVDEFERSILFYADAHSRAGGSVPSLVSDSGSSPSSTAGNSSVSSLVSSAAASTEQLVSGPQIELAEGLAAALCAHEDGPPNEWELEVVKVDRAVRILPGVKALLESIPKGRYAVATSGAKTYGTLPSPLSSYFDPDWADRRYLGCSTWLPVTRGYHPARSDHYRGRSASPRG
jgi:hypothetical protein